MDYCYFRCVVLFVLISSDLAEAQYQNQEPSLYPEGCDLGFNDFHKDGVVQNVSLFPWLGMLQIKVSHNRRPLKINSGILLIHEEYAIANAEDYIQSFASSRPKFKALFITGLSRPWVCKVKYFTLNPEAYNDDGDKQTIAIVHLVLKRGERVPVRPICWPIKRLSRNDQLYVAGYTIGTKSHHLKKVAIQVQHINRTICSYYYSKNNMEEPEALRTRSQCCFANLLTEPCVWDSGMVLLSNAAGFWTPVGLGLAGAGCSAPSRFITLSGYWAWIHKTITNKGILPENMPPKTSIEKYYKILEAFGDEGEMQKFRARDYDMN